MSFQTFHLMPGDTLEVVTDDPAIVTLKSSVTTTATHTQRRERDLRRELKEANRRIKQLAHHIDTLLSQDAT